MNKGSKLIITLCVMLGTQSFPVVKGMNIAKDMSNINGAPHLKALEGSSMNSLSHSVSGKVTNYPKNEFDLQLHNVNHHPDFSKEKPNNKWPQQEKEHTELQSIDLAVKLIKERESVSGTSENEILLNVDALLGGIYRVFKSRSNSFSAFEDIEFISGYILESLSLHLREEVLLKYKARRTELINNISDLHRTADKINGAKYLVDYLLKTKNFLKLLASELHCITMNPVSKINFVESYRYGMKSSATGHLQLLLTELYKTEKFKFNPYVGDPTQWDYFLHQYIIYEVDSLRISRIEKPEEFDYEHNYYKLLNFPKFKADNQIEVRKKLMAHFLNNNDIFKSNLILKNDELERNYLTIYQVLEYLKNYNGILIDLDTIPGGDNYHLLETPIIQKYILGGFKVTK